MGAPEKYDLTWLDTHLISSSWEYRKKVFQPLYKEIGAICLDSVQWNWIKVIWPSSRCCCSVALLCLTLCDPMDCSTPGFPVFHYLPEFAQTQVHWVDDAIQPSHPLLPVSSYPQSFPATGSFPVSQLFTSGGQSIGASASVLPMTIQDWFPWGWTGWISLQSKGLSTVFSGTTIQKHWFFGAQPSLWSSAHIHTQLLEKP